MSKTEQAISIFEVVADTLTDEVVELENCRKQFIHHVNNCVGSLNPWCILLMR